jgi:iron complex outermembrane receptor protein
VNFITRTDQEGFLVSGDYRWIQGSKGDYSGAASFGHKQDGFRIFGAAGYQRRSELRFTDRDFAVRSYPENPQGAWTGGGNPGNFDFNGTVGGINLTTDLGCEGLGGFRSAPGSNTDRCFTQFGQFDNLVEPEERFQAYIETEIDLTDNASFRLTGLYAFTNTRVTSSPSYLPTLPPSTNAAFGNGSLFVIPGYAPALWRAGRMQPQRDWRAGQRRRPAGAVPAIPARRQPLVPRGKQRSRIGDIEARYRSDALHCRVQRPAQQRHRFRQQPDLQRISARL